MPTASAVSTQFYVYLLKCSDNSIYVDITDNLEKCLVQHFNGDIPATRKKLPVEIYSYVAFNDNCKALAFKHFLKTRAGRLFIKNRWI